jgi:hypothetical protein
MSISAIGLAPSAESTIKSRTVITSRISAASNDTLPALDESTEPVIAGPFHLFDGSFIIEFLQPAPWRSASVLMRGTYKMSHPLWRDHPERHPQLPPLHLVRLHPPLSRSHLTKIPVQHFDQAETIQVLHGTLSFTLDYTQRTVHVLSGARTVIEPLTPHIVGPPIADPADPDADVVILVWAHPDDRPGHMDMRFFLNLFMHVSDAHAGRSNLDLGRVMLMQ